MKPRKTAGARRLVPAVVGGLLVFAAGTGLALALLPEWSSAAVSQERFFRTQYRRLASRAGFHLAAGEPRVSLVAGFSRPPGREPQVSLEARASHFVRRGEEAQARRLDIAFSRDGQPVEIVWDDLAAPVLSPPDLRFYEDLVRGLAPLLLAPGESIGESRKVEGRSIASWRLIDVAGSSPGAHILATLSPPIEVSIERLPGRLAQVPASPEDHTAKTLAALLIYALAGLAVAGVFLSLVLHGRIDLANGAFLGAVVLLSGNPLRLFNLQASPWLTILIVFFSTPWRALGVFFAWSAGESLLRSLRPDFTTSLDTLRLGRLGPRGGRALLFGFALGAALAGLQLVIYSLAAVLPGIAPARPSITLPLFDYAHSPLGSGISTAALAALAIALALRFLPGRWAVPAAALLAGYVLSPIRMTPFPAELAANTALAGLLVWTGRRHGLTALLVTAVVSALLPAAVFSALHLAWMPGSFVLTAGLAAALLALGFVGIARSETIETGRVPAPAFMRRLAEERRLQHEVDLLGRMQTGLLPQEMPRLEGYQITARSVLASEAGGDLYDFQRDEAGCLWIAAGDVAGHGYSCAVAQAMVKAGLLSLIEPAETPADVLRQLDRVLRGVSTDHSFTSLALVRLDPATGEALLANAGHPYPLVFAGGRIAEVVLPGLPLGQGPERPYSNQAFQLPAGGALLLCSDGLSDALDRNGNPYGFDRVREVLQVMGHRPAVEIVDALLNDCRRHLGAEQAPDDVTVVVVKRG